MLADSYDWFVANRRVAAEGASASPHRRTPSSRLLTAIKSISGLIPG